MSNAEWLAGFRLRPEQLVPKSRLRAFKAEMLQETSDMRAERLALDPTHLSLKELSPLWNQEDFEHPPGPWLTIVRDIREKYPIVLRGVKGSE
jgi:hypothetical protein